jgi:hypothetical protein
MRIDDDIFNRIEQARGDKTKVEFLRELIINSLNPNPNSTGLNSNSNELINNSIELNSEIGQLKTELEHQKEIDNIRLELIRSLENQLGFLQLQFQQVMKANDQLLLNAAPQENPKRKWYQFWK